MKKALIAAAAAIAAIIILGIFFLGGGGDIGRAIDLYEGGDYKDAIILLNDLLKTAGYEEKEKIYFYRCRSINRLAEKLNKKYEDELKELAGLAGNREAFDRARRDLEDDLKDINGDIRGDLELRFGKMTAVIAPGGRFYHDFTSRYKGSGLIEDLDFEEVERVERTGAPGLLAAISSFYSKYPNTDYVPQLVRMLFRRLEKGEIDTKGRQEFLTTLIVNFGTRFPTSSEFHRIYTCTGDNVNVRDIPGTRGNLVGKIERDEIILQLEKSMDTVQVGDTKDYWYRVAGLGGIRGWIFGKFVAAIDLSKYRTEEKAETWSFEENFSDWEDANTPRSWMHLERTDRRALIRERRGGTGMIRLDPSKGKSSGLYRRTASSRAFTIQVRARFVSGDSALLVAYSLPGGKSLYLRMREDSVDVSGWKVPVRATEWHDYRIENGGGEFTKLFIDGELVSSRLQPAALPGHESPGLYILVAEPKRSASLEMEYLKMRE